MRRWAGRGGRRPARGTGRRRAIASLVTVLAVTAAGGCGGDDGDGDGLSSAESSSGAPGAGDAGGGASDLTLPDEVVAVDGDVAEVSALDNTFNAPGIRVEAGTTVRWVNNGRQDHDVIPVEGEWGVEVEGFHPGDTYEHTFTEPGTFNYYCTIHGTAARGMVGVVVVE